MAKVKAEHALKVKGKKAPRPEAASLGDIKAGPRTKPSMQKKFPDHSVEAGDQSMAPKTKKEALTLECAPEGVKGVNEGESLPMEKDYSLKK